MSLQFVLGGGPTTVNRISVTALHRIMASSFVSLEMFSVQLVHSNDYCLRYQLDSITLFIPLRIYKRHDLSLNLTSLLLC